jgi:hypothetical protein
MGVKGRPTVKDINKRTRKTVKIRVTMREQKQK